MLLGGGLCVSVGVSVLELVVKRVLIENGLNGFRQ
jgi:hypothetical protein